jgi:hypothetical protein
MELFGLVLWEAITLLFVLLGGIGLMALRRKANGRPAFTDQDRLLYFGDLNLDISMPELCLKLCVAALVCLIVGFFERLVLAQFGPGLLTATFVLTSFSIVRFTLK